MRDDRKKTAGVPTPAGAAAGRHPIHNPSKTAPGAIQNPKSAARDLQPKIQNFTKTRLRRGKIRCDKTASRHAGGNPVSSSPDAEAFLCDLTAEQLEFDFPPTPPPAPDSSD